MKTTLKLSAVLLAVCFAVTSVACTLVGKDSKSPYAYKIYTDDDFQFFVKPDDTRVDGGSYTNPSAVAEREVSIAGQKYSLSYIESERHLFTDVDRYASDGNALEIRFAAGTDEVRSIIFYPPESVLGGNIESESDYNRFVKQLILDFANEDFDKYDYKCTSTCELKGGLDGFETLDGFIPKNGSRRVFSYDFTFSNTIEGVGTSDYIHVTISPYSELSLVEVEFNPHEFDNVAVPNLAKRRLDATLSAAMQAYADMDFENETVYSVDWKQESVQWRMLNGIPSYVCTYIAVRKSSEHEEGYPQTVMFYVQPTVESQAEVE